MLQNDDCGILCLNMCVDMCAGMYFNMYADDTCRNTCLHTCLSTCRNTCLNTCLLLEDSADWPMCHRARSLRNCAWTASSDDGGEYPSALADVISGHDVRVVPREGILPRMAPPLLAANEARNLGHSILAMHLSILVIKLCPCSSSTVWCRQSATLLCFPPGEKKQLHVHSILVMNRCPDSPSAALTWERRGYAHFDRRR